MRTLRPLVGRFPRFFYRVASVVGWVLFHSRPGLRRKVVRNMLPLCDNDLPRARREGLEAVRQVAKYYVDLTTLPRRDMARFEAEHLTLENASALDVLGTPGPVIMVSAHTGNPELAIQALTFRGRDFVALVEPLEPPAFSDYMLALRSSAGGAFYEADFGGLRALLTALRDGQLAGLMGDRDIQRAGICVALAGKRVKLPRGPWELARRVGAPVVPVFCTRVAGDDFRVRMEAAIIVAADGDPEIAVRAGAEAFAGMLEAHLRRAPGQWAVLEDFWNVHACEDCHDG